MKTEIKVIAFYAQAVDGGSLGKENCGARTDSSSTKVNLVDLANTALAERMWMTVLGHRMRKETLL